MGVGARRELADLVRGSAHLREKGGGGLLELARPELFLLVQGLKAVDDDRDQLRIRKWNGGPHAERERGLGRIERREDAVLVVFGLGRIEPRPTQLVDDVESIVRERHERCGGREGGGGHRCLSAAGARGLDGCRRTSRAPWGSEPIRATSSGA